MKTLGYENIHIYVLMLHVSFVTTHQAVFNVMSF